MADPNLQYDPVQGWEDTTETVFKTNPSDAEVRPMFQRLFNQIRDFINGTFLTWIKATFPQFTDILSKTNTTAFTPTANYHPATKKYVDDTTASVVLGQIPDGSLTDAKLSNEAGQIKDTVTTHLTDNSAHVPHLGITTNNGNVYNVDSIEVINDGDKFSIKFNAVATGTATLNISSDGTARTLKKPDGSDFKPKAGIYSFIRDNVNFQLLGEGGEYGTALASDVRSTKTLGTGEGVVQGTLDLTNLIESNIKNGIVIDGKTGNFAAIAASDLFQIVLTGYTGTFSTTVYTPCGKSFKVNSGGAIRISFTIKSSDGTSVYGRVYKNGVAIGTQRTTTSTIGTTYTEDFVCNADDTFTIYIKGASGAGYQYLSDVYLKFDGGQLITIV